MVYLKSVENVITLGKLIGLLFLFCLPLLSILFLKTKRKDLARTVMGVMRQPYRDLPHNLLRDNGRLLGSSITTLASTHTILREIKMFSTLPPE